MKSIFRKIKACFPKNFGWKYCVGTICATTLVVFGCLQVFVANQAPDGESQDIAAQYSQNFSNSISSAIPDSGSQSDCTQSNQSSSADSSYAQDALNLAEQFDFNSKLMQQVAAQKIVDLATDTDDGSAYDAEGVLSDNDGYYAYDSENSKASDGQGSGWFGNGFTLGVGNDDNDQAYVIYATKEGKVNDKSVAAKSMNFFYDKNRSAWKNLGFQTYDMPVGTSTPSWKAYNSNCTSVYIDDTFSNYQPTNCSYWFNNCSKVTYINLANLDTSNVTSMKYMFAGCSKLATLDTSTLNTNKVTDMSFMFQNCSSLTQINLYHLKTAKVTTMESMFAGCAVLDNVFIDNFAIDCLTSAKNMFNGCTLLDTIYCNKDWKESKKLYQSTNMFLNCVCLPGYDKSYVSATNAHPNNGSDGYFSYVEDTPYVCYAPKNIGLVKAYTLTFCYDDTMVAKAAAGFKIYSLNDDQKDPGWVAIASKCKVVNFDSSFANYEPTTCYKWFYAFNNSALSIDLTNLDTRSVTNMQSMFQGCKTLTELDVTGLNTSNVKSMKQMFYGCSALKTIDLNGFDVGSLTNTSTMFYNCSSLSLIECDNNWVTSSKVKTTDSNNMFYGCKLLPHFSDMSLTYQTNITYAYPDNGRFGYFNKADEAYAVYSANIVENLNATSLTFFYDKNKQYWVDKGCKCFAVNTAKNDPGWLTYATKVTNVSFDDSFAAYKPTTTYKWFAGFNNANLTFNFANLNTVEVLTTESMFQDCTSLKNFDLRCLDTTNSTEMKAMFKGCCALTNLDINGWVVSNLKDTTSMFEGCASLTSIRCENNWATASKVTADTSTDMFTGCTSLPYFASMPEADRTNITYAYPDNGTSGYFKAVVTTKEAYAVYAYLAGTVGTKTVPAHSLSFFYDDNKTSWAPSSTYKVYEIPTAASENPSMPAWKEQNYSCKSVYFDYDFKQFAPKNCYMWFSGFKNITSIDCSNLNTSNCDNMHGMFFDCKSLETCNVSGWSTGKVVNMASMFHDCYALTNLNVSGFDTSNVTDMHTMFASCKALESLDVCNFDMHNVRTTEGMFSSCKSLATIYCNNDWLSQWAGGGGSTDMFSGCSSLAHYRVTDSNINYAHPFNGTSGYFTPKV